MLTFAIYFQTTKFDFLVFDDENYITTNQHIQKGLNLESIKWAFTTSHHVSWQPLVWLSFQADIDLYGLDPAGFHLTNILLHLLASIMLYLLLIKATLAPWKTIFVVSVFALHPLHVESVAWISERKDLLSAIFWFLTMYLYIGYTKKQTFFRYSLVFFSFLLGLMSKPVLVTLPLVLILFDFWPLERFKFNFKNLLKSTKEKVPLLVLTTLSSAITIYIQNSGDAMQTTNQLSLTYRFLNAFTSYMDYILMTLYPANLVAMYPHLGEDISVPKALLSLLTILLVTGFAIYNLQKGNSKYNYFTFGWLWFLGILVPTIGIIQVGSQSLADRYMYIPIIGLAIIVAWGLEDVLERFFNSKKLFVVAGTLITLASVVMALASYKQISYWENDGTLFKRTSDITENNFIAHNNLGHWLLESNRVEEAIEQFKIVTTIEPRDHRALVNLGLSNNILGNQDLAIKYYKESLKIEPTSTAFNNMGVIYMSQNKTTFATESFNIAIEMDENFSDPYLHMGNIHFQKKEFSDAIFNFKKYISLRPLDKTGYFWLAFTYVQTEDFELALKTTENILEFSPNSKDAKNNIKHIKSLLEKQK